MATNDDLEKGPITDNIAPAGASGDSLPTFENFCKGSVNHRAVKCRNSASSYLAWNGWYAMLACNSFVALIGVNAIFSIGGVNTILCIGSLNSMLSIGSVNSFLAVGCSNSFMKVCSL
ncbi:hypothetical protein ACHAWF_000602 [Thalassiosira exigua]